MLSPLSVFVSIPIRVSAIRSPCSHQQPSHQKMCFNPYKGFSHSITFNTIFLVNFISRFNPYKGFSHSITRQSCARVCRNIDVSIPIRVSAIRSRRECGILDIFGFQGTSARTKAIILVHSFFCLITQFIHNAQPFIQRDFPPLRG